MKKGKKFLAILLGVLVLFNLSACNCYDVFVFFYDIFDTSTKITVKEIHAYTASGEEIIGEYVEEYEYKKSKSQTTAIAKRTVEPLNSAAPIELYYVLAVKEGDEIVIEYKLHVENSKGIKSVNISYNVEYNGDLKAEMPVTDIKNEGKGIYSFSFPFTVGVGNYLCVGRIFDDYGKAHGITFYGGEPNKREIAFSKETDAKNEREPVCDIDFVSQHPWLNTSPDLIESIVTYSTYNISYLSPVSKLFEFEGVETVSKILSFFKELKSTKDVRGQIEERHDVITYEFIFKDGTVETLTFRTSVYYVYNSYKREEYKLYNYYIEDERYAVLPIWLYDNPYHYKFYARNEYKHADIISCVDNSIIGEVDLSKFKFVHYSEAEDGPLPDIDLAQYIKTDSREIVFYTDKIFSLSHSSGGTPQIYKLIGDLTYNDLLVEN